MLVPGITSQSKTGSDRWENQRKDCKLTDTYTDIQTIQTHTQQRWGSERATSSSNWKLYKMSVLSKTKAYGLWHTWAKHSQKQLDGIEQWNLVTSQLHLFPGEDICEQRQRSTFILWCISLVIYIYFLLSMTLMNHWCSLLYETSPTKVK